MPGGTVVLVRTHYVDEQVLAMARRLSDGPVAFVVDEERGQVEVPSAFGKISLTRAVAASRGLAVPADFTWRCGDYGLYLAAEQYPNARLFWLIEYDVEIHARDPGCVLRGFDRHAGIDLLGLSYMRRESDWCWYEMMHPFSNTIHGTLYPVVRLSAAAIASMYDARRLISARFGAEYPLDRFPNDEVFTATVLTNLGFTCQDLNVPGEPVYAVGRTFFIGQPLSRRILQRCPPDGMIHHPVLSGEAFMVKARQFLTWCTLAQLTDAAPSLVEGARAECGEATAAALHREIGDRRATLAGGQI